MMTLQSVEIECPRCKVPRAIRESYSTKNGKLIVLICSHFVEEKSVSEVNPTLAVVPTVPTVPVVQVVPTLEPEIVSKPEPKIDLSELTKNLKRFTCVFCFKDLPIKSFLASGSKNQVNFRLECGHINSISVGGIIETEPKEEEKPKTPPPPAIPFIPPPVKVKIERDSRWDTATSELPTFFQYQRDGIEFIEKSNYRCLIGDEMGLGKTIQAIGAIRYSPEVLTPALIVCPAGLIYKWQRELKKWLNDKFSTLEWAPMVHLGGNTSLLDGQKIHIISSSLFSKPEVAKSIAEYGFKLVVLDESHQYKNDKSNRTEAILEIAAKIPHKILLSGTSILNRTMEYYNSLYLIRPEHWRTKNWLASYCMFDKDGKNIGMNEYSRDKFFRLTKEYILRRRKAEVLSDLPEKMVNYTFLTVNDNQNFVKGYNAVLDELEDKLNEMKSDAAMSMDVLSLMTRLRHLVGMIKVRLIAERVIQFLENTEDEKICIGTHHKLVMEFLAGALKDWNPITISDENPRIKDERSNDFRDNKSRRVMIASILGCGIGRDLQFCPNVIVAEREWNRAMEHQFEDRFHRVGLKNKVMIDYFMAQGTIDEFFHEMVVHKTAISHQGMDSGFHVDNETLQDLAKRVVAKRMRYVG